MSRPGLGFPIPPFEWPHVGRRWPSYNVESDQADGLVMWMPWGGSVPGTHSHVDQVSSLVFTENGTPVWVFDDEHGWSMLFDDGSSEYLETPKAVVTGPPFTLTCWFYMDASTRSAFLGVNNGNWNHTAYLNAAWGTLKFTIIENAGLDINATVGYSQNTWHHACAVEAASDDHSIFLDGGNKGTSATSKPFTGVDRTTIGRRGDASEYMSGRISDDRIYNRPFSDAQVAELSHPDTKWELFQIPRRLWRLGVVAPPPATIVPVAMHHYRRRRL